jgi:hypothetical protein
VYSAVWSVECQPTFRRIISPTYSGSKNKPSKKPARSRGPELFITTSNPASLSLPIRCLCDDSVGVPGIEVDLREVGCNTVNYTKEDADTPCLTDIIDVWGLNFLKGQMQSFWTFQRASLIRNESASFYKMSVICTFCILLRSMCFFVWMFKIKCKAWLAVCVVLAWTTVRPSELEVTKWVLDGHDVYINRYSSSWRIYNTGYISEIE